MRDASSLLLRGYELPTEEQIVQLRQHLAAMGVKDPRVTHPTTTLEDLFIRVVRENTPSGQSSVGSGPS